MDDDIKKTMKPGYPMQELADLIAEAERTYRLKLFDNIDQASLADLPLSEHALVIGNALLSRADHRGFVLGKRILALRTELDRETEPTC